MQTKSFVLLLDIHTHQPPQPGNWAIQNLYQDFEQVHLPSNFSIGLHPWYIQQQSLQQELQLLGQYAAHAHVLAIGECGLDKVCATDFVLQTAAFAAQIQLANQVNKPLVIHCVRAYTEVLGMLRQANNRVPVIFHGFNKNGQLAKQLVEEGYYLSFGKALQQQRLQHVLATVPLNHILLETDDATIDITGIYQLAASALSVDIDTLSLQVQQNAVAIFGTDYIKQ